MTRAERSDDFDTAYVDYDAHECARIHAYAVPLRPDEESEAGDGMGVVVMDGPDVLPESETRGELAESLRDVELRVRDVPDRALGRAVGGYRGALLLGPRPTSAVLDHVWEGMCEADRAAQTFRMLRPSDRERVVLLLRAGVLARAWYDRVRRGEELPAATQSDEGQ